MFERLKARFRIFIQSINSKLWEIIINNLFISTHQIHGEVVDKIDSLWTVEEKRKFEIDFKSRTL